MFTPAFANTTQESTITNFFKQIFSIFSQENESEITARIPYHRGHHAPYGVPRYIDTELGQMKWVGKTSGYDMPQGNFYRGVDNGGIGALVIKEGNGIPQQIFTFTNEFIRNATAQIEEISDHNFALIKNCAGSTKNMAHLLYKLIGITGCVGINSLREKLCLADSVREKLCLADAEVNGVIMHSQIANLTTAACNSISSFTNDKLRDCYDSLHDNSNLYDGLIAILIVFGIIGCCILAKQSHPESSKYYAEQIDEEMPRAYGRPSI